MRYLILLLTLLALMATEVRLEELASTSNGIEYMHVVCWSYTDPIPLDTKKQNLGHFGNLGCDGCSGENTWTNINHIDCKDADIFEVYSSSTHRIPKNIFIQFTNIKSFEMVYQNLSIISAEDFTNAGFLQTLNLTGNNLQDFPATIFRNTPRIQVLDLSVNKFETLEFYGVEPANMVIAIHLNNNKLKSVPLGLERFQLLHLLSLSHNHIKEVDVEKNIPITIRNLYLDHNELNSYKEGTRLLEVLDISNNPLSEDRESVAKEFSISETGLKKCKIDPRVIKLIATNNNIDEIILYQSYDNHLQYLNLSKNFLTSIENLAQLETLIELDVSHNLLSEIDSKIFKKLNHLQKLVFRENHLKAFEFNGLSSVNYLDLSYNYLENIRINSDLPALSSLHIEGNNLTSINTNIKIRAPNLQKLFIHDNNFECEQLRSDLMLLRFENFRVEENYDESQMRKNFSSNVNGIGCYKQTDEYEDRIKKLEDQVKVIMTMLVPTQTTDSPGN